jgi:hypothetical protein
MSARQLAFTATDAPGGEGSPFSYFPDMPGGIAQWEGFLNFTVDAFNYKSRVRIGVR